MSSRFLYTKLVQINLKHTNDGQDCTTVTFHCLFAALLGKRRINFNNRRVQETVTPLYSFAILLVIKRERSRLVVEDRYTVISRIPSLLCQGKRRINWYRRPFHRYIPSLLCWGKTKQPGGVRYTVISCIPSLHWQGREELT